MYNFVSMVFVIILFCIVLFLCVHVSACLCTPERFSRTKHLLFQGGEEPDPSAEAAAG